MGPLVQPLLLTSEPSLQPIYTYIIVDAFTEGMDHFALTCCKDFLREVEKSRMLTKL